MSRRTAPRDRNPTARSDEDYLDPRPSRQQNSESDGTGQDQDDVVRLPSVNPFAGRENTRNRNRAVRQRETQPEEEEEEEEGVTTLPSANPFAASGASGRNNNPPRIPQAAARPTQPTRSSRRAASPPMEPGSEGEEEGEEDGVISLPSVNPFAGRNAGRTASQTSARPAQAYARSAPQPARSSRRRTETEEEEEEEEPARAKPAAARGRGIIPPTSRLLSQAPKAPAPRLASESESENESEEEATAVPPSSGRAAANKPQSVQETEDEDETTETPAKGPKLPVVNPTSRATVPSKTRASAAVSGSEEDGEDEEPPLRSPVVHSPSPPPTRRPRTGPATTTSMLASSAPSLRLSKAAPVTSDNESESSGGVGEPPVRDEDEDQQGGPREIPVDPNTKNKGKQKEVPTGKAKPKVLQGAGKAGGSKMATIQPIHGASTSDSWSGEVGRPEGFEHHHHHHHHHHSKKEHPPLPYGPGPVVETSSSSSSSSTISSDSSSSVDCECPRGKHHRHCRFRHEHHHRREFDCDCPHGKHRRGCQHWRRRHDPEYEFDCDCRGGFHHEHCPFWRHTRHHDAKPWDQPPWWPYPFPPTITQPSHKLTPFGKPLYPNIPQLPNLFDQAKDAYYTLPVPPTDLLRDLQEMQRRQVPYPSQPAPQSPPNPPDLIKFENGVSFALKEPDLLKALPVILYQQLQSYYVDMVYNRLQSMIQVRFAERKGEKLVNRVHVVQRYRTAWNAVMSYRPKLDVDLVFPGDFVLRRWCIDSETSDEDKPNTISKAMDLDPTSVLRGEVYQKDLDWIIKAVWAQLNGDADTFIFPGGNSEVLKYIGSFKDVAPEPGANRIKLLSVGDKNPIRINLFIKVAIRLNGQDLVVGVDQASAMNEDKYQMIKMYNTPNGPPSESPLSPIEQCALVMLGWWKRDKKHGNPPPDVNAPKIRASHFSLALKACHELDPASKMYISPEQMHEQFSVKRSIVVAYRIALYLQNAYKLELTPFILSLSACGIQEAVYTQMASVGDLKPLSDAFDELVKFLEPSAGGGGAGNEKKQ